MAQQLKTYAIRVGKEGEERPALIYVKVDTVAVDAGYDTLDFKRDGEKVASFNES